MQLTAQSADHQDTVVVHVDTLLTLSPCSSTIQTGLTLRDISATDGRIR
jgi:hypothetical protein